MLHNPFQFSLKALEKVWWSQWSFPATPKTRRKQSHQAEKYLQSSAVRPTKVQLERAWSCKAAEEAALQPKRVAFLQALVLLVSIALQTNHAAATFGQVNSLSGPVASHHAFDFSETAANFAEESESVLHAASRMTFCWGSDHWFWAPCTSTFATNANFPALGNLQSSAWLSALHLVLFPKRSPEVAKSSSFRIDLLLTRPAVL